MDSSAMTVKSPARIADLKRQWQSTAGNDVVASPLQACNFSLDVGL